MDAVQDGMLKAFSGLDAFDGRSGFRTWLVRVVSNAAIDLGRKRNRRQMFGIGFSSGSAPGGATTTRRASSPPSTTTPDAASTATTSAGPSTPHSTASAPRSG